MGWNTTTAVQFTHRYSFIADFGGYSDSKLGSTHTFLAGPKFTFHRGPFAPFAEVMMGAQNLAPKGQPSYVAFTEAVGGGLDVAIARRWSVRLFQADFIYAADHEKTKSLLNQFYGVRFSTGLVWNVGKRRRPMVAAEKPTVEKPASDEPASPETTVESASAANPAATPEPVTNETTAASTPQPTVEAAAPAATPVPSAPAPTETASAPETSKPVDVKEAPAKEEVAKAAPALETPAPVAPAPATTPVTEASAQNVPAPVPQPVPGAARKTEATSAPVAAEPAKKVEVATAQPAPAMEAAASTPATSAAAPAPSTETAATASAASAKSSETPAADPAAALAKPNAPAPAIQQVAKLRFPYDQYPSLLSTQDKRALDALASRMKLEPQSKAIVVGSAPQKSGNLAAQRAVNSKDYLVQKGIAADRIEALEQVSDPKPIATGRRAKPSALRTQLVFVPAGASFDAAGATTVDEQKVKPEHLHVAHPEWHEK